MMLYFLKSVLCAAVFLLLYRLLLHRERMYGFNRAYLLASLAASFLIPLITFTVEEPIHPAPPVFDFVAPHQAVSEGWTIDAAPPRQEPVSLAVVLVAVYTVVTLYFLIRFARSLAAIARRLSHSEIVRRGSALIVLTDEEITPHTFLNYIFINREDYNLGRIEYEVLLHEWVHAAQRHSLDKIAVEMILVFMWFNPALYFYKRYIYLNHEFLADDGVLSRSDDPAAYQELLIYRFNGAGRYPVTSPFSFLTTKKRLIMMTKKTSRKRSLIKALATLPLLAAALLVFSGREVVTAQNSDSAGQGADPQTADVNSNGASYLVQPKNPASSQELTTQITASHLYMTNLGGKAKYSVVKRDNGWRVRAVTGDRTFEGDTITTNIDDSTIVRFYPVITDKDKNVAVVRMDYKGDKTVMLENILREKLKGFDVDYGKVSLGMPGMNPLVVIGEEVLEMDGASLARLSSLPPDNIASAASVSGRQATRRWGEKGKNGAIVISTKKKSPAAPAAESQVINIVGGDVGSTSTPAKRVVTPVPDDSVAHSGESRVFQIVGGADGPTKIRIRGESAAAPGGSQSDPTVSVMEMLGNKEISNDTVRHEESVSMIRLRGNASMTDGNEPLIVVDGKIVDVVIPEDFNFRHADVDAFARLVNVPRQDIKSIEVQKNDAAIELWGQRAANGVLLIETKNKDANARSSNEVQKKSGESRDSDNKPGLIQDGESVYYTVDSMKGNPEFKGPEFLGESDNFSSYIAKNTRYPSEASSKGISGKAYIDFVVDKNGDVVNVKASEDNKAHEVLTTEAIRVISASPKWKPATKNGEKVGVLLKVPVTFSLH